MKLNVVLVEPEIPQNTGNIARTCAAIGAKIHLVYPLSFSISLNQFLEKYPPEKNNMFFATTKGKHIYCEPDYSSMSEVFVLFGKETKGLPEDLLLKYINNTIRIPMRKTLRSLNLANSVCVVVYDILRQCNFDNLQEISDYFD